MSRAVARHIAGLVVLLAIGLPASACATRFYVPPSGPGEPFAEASMVWRELTERCRGARVFVAEIRVSGSVGEPRQGIDAPLHGALTRGDDIYLEVPAPGRSVVQMAGRAGQSVFLLPRDERFLRATSQEIVEALTGLRWGARDLLNVLTGCVAMPAGEPTGTRHGERATIELGGGARAWVRLTGGSWQLDAASRDGMLIEYRARDGAYPSNLRVSSMAAGVTPLNLTFTVSQLSVNIDQPPATFELAVPANYSPIMLEDIRTNRPLKEAKGIK